MSEKYRSVEALYTRTHDMDLKSIGVICPNCGTGHQFGNVHLSGKYIMPPETYLDHKDHLITPKYDAFLPINPETYKLFGFPMVVNCYNCKSRMLMVPNHLREPIEAFNSWKMFTCGTYFLDDPDPLKRYVRRRIFFSDVNFLLTALLDRVEFENIELNPVSYAGMCSKGIPLVWEFDIGYSKDQDFKMLDDIQIVRDTNGHTGYLGFSDTFEWNLHAKNAEGIDRRDATKRFLTACSVILDFVHDWCEDHDEDTFKDRTTDPFREFYRRAYRDLCDMNLTQQDSFKWFTEESPYDHYSAMTSN